MIKGEERWEMSGKSKEQSKVVLAKNRSTPEAVAFWDHVEKVAAQVRAEAEHDADRRSSAFITNLRNHM